jgi:ferric enterobactin receptor
MKRNKFLLIVFLCSGFLQANGQSLLCIQGKIADSISKDPLSFATVSISTHADSAALHSVTADPNGFFRCFVPRVPSYHLFAGRIGYRDLSITIPNSNNDTLLDAGIIFVAPVATLSDTAVVKARKQLLNIFLDRIDYQVQLDSNMRDQNALMAISRLPFVQVKPSGAIEYKQNKRFLVLVNGKRAGILSSKPEVALNAFPAAAIKKIQLITQPSAHYTEQGYDAVINIETVNGYYRGFTGSVQASADTRNNTGGNMFLLLQKNMSSWQILFDFRGAGNYNEITGFSRIGEGLQTEEQRFEQLQRYRNRAGVLEVSYNREWTGNWSAGLYGSKGRVSDKRNNEAMFRFTPSGVQTDYQFTGRQLRSEEVWEMGGELTKRNPEKGRFKKTFTGIDESFNGESQMLTEINGRRQITNWKNTESALVFSVSSPASGNVFWTAGLSAIDRIFDNEVKSDTFAAVSGWAPGKPPFVSMRNRQQIAGVYGALRKSGKKYLMELRTSVGISAYTISGNGTQTDSLFFNLLPRLTVKYQINVRNSITLKTSKTVQRPNYFNAGVFYNYFDPQNIVSGNPFLYQQFVYTASLTYDSYSKNRQSAFYAEGEWRSISNTISKFTRYDSATGKIITRYEDAGNTGAISITLGYSGNLSKNITLSTSHHAGLIAYRYNAEQQRNNGFYYSLNFDMAWTFLKFYKIQASGFINTATPTVQGNETSSRVYSLHLSRPLAHNKILISLFASNFLRENLLNRVIISQPGFYQEVESSQPFRLIGCSLSWRFGKLETTPRKLKKVTLSDLKSQQN